MGTKIYIDFTKHEFDVCMDRLKKELSLSTAVNSNIDKKETNVRKLSANREDDGYEDKISSWNQVETENWFKNRRISIPIRENMSPCDGRLLSQLYKMSNEVPEFFYSTLRSDTKASLKDIAIFASELDLLFSR